jgi:hypothetical protein
MDENVELQKELEVLVSSIADMREYRNSDEVRAKGPAERTALSQEQIAMEERADAIRTYLGGDAEAEAAADEEAELEEDLADDVGEAAAEEDADEAAELEEELEEELADVDVDDIEVVAESDTLEAADLTEEQA